MLDLALVCRLEAAAVRGWPATIEHEQADGWLLRATPGLDRGRSNNALTPCRALAADEIEPAIERVRAFAAEHRIRPGIQISPLELHTPLLSALDRRGWERQWPTVVLTGPTDYAAGGPEATLTIADHADPAWLRAWARCEPGRDVEAHATTVLRALGGRGCFARLAEEAVAIAVPWQGLVGMFCVAVDPARRRTGLATQLITALMARYPEAELAYLQVEERNAAARSFYGGLGFSVAYRYCHLVGPGEGVGSGASRPPL
ncbi:MAG TPA: GNAT family N-acetyltransferase [Solirubrobacteraceae bacterium]|jgi:GNAT superfamily N-acetyltransferase